MVDKNDKTASPRSGPAEATRLRDDIDRAATGDKVAFSDPAAAPLGTDAEAGGATPSAQATANARQAERADGASSMPKKDPAMLQKTTGQAVGMLALGAVAVLCLVALWKAI